ncbi:pesticidal protein, partial [Bacillus thuringiensis]
MAISRIVNPIFTEQEDLNNIITQINALFVSSTQDKLKPGVSDYWIEEIVLKVDALSDEVFGTEKKALRKLVNQAKRLSKARNLLIGGSFENWDAWYKGQKVVRLSDHELLKGDHVLLPPPGLSPSYIFQKVEESKLKANTRYTVSGFIAHATDLEIVVSRYGQEIKKVVQVPYGEAFPLTSSGPVCCIPHSTSNGTLGNPHFFSYSIDVGALDVDTNPGIEFGLRIVNPTGMARVSNLEIREDRPLAANEIRQVQRVARNWRTEYEKERAEVTSLIQPVINRI